MAKTLAVADVLPGKVPGVQRGVTSPTESRTIMKNSPITAPMRLGLSFALALSAWSGAAQAQYGTPGSGYLEDPRGAVIKSDFGLCWRAGGGVPVSTRECDPNYVAPPVAVIEQPEPVRPPAPPPPPMVVVVPVVERITLDADALFDFDKATLRPAGRVALDDFVSRLKGIDPEMITAIGYTDRLGSTAYNQRLSEQRAQTVRAYLIDHGIQPDRVQAEGRGEAEPVTAAGECQGKQSSKVIACLQRDRRVEVEVKGNKVAVQ